MTTKPDHHPSHCRFGVLTCSTSRARNMRPDESGEIVKALCAKWWGAEVTAYRVVPDDPRVIARILKNWCEQGVDVIFTTGGTGLSPTDVTPEATREVLDREAPGLAERMRAVGGRKTPLAWLSRGVAGLRGKTLIINLPGNPRSVEQNMSALKDILPHAIDIAGGRHREGHPWHFG